MKLAIIGSRSITVENVENYLPSGVRKIVSGGAKGVDAAAARFARSKGIPFVEFLPEYEKYARAAPLRRNEKIAAYADEALAFWDGISKGTAYTIRLFERLGKRVTVIRL